MTTNNARWENIISFFMQYIMTNLLFMAVLALFVNNKIIASFLLLIYVAILFRRNILMKYNLDKE